MLMGNNTGKWNDKIYSKSKTRSADLTGARRRIEARRLEPRGRGA